MNVNVKGIVSLLGSCICVSLGTSAIWAIHTCNEVENAQAKGKIEGFMNGFEMGKYVQYVEDKQKYNGR